MKVTSFPDRATVQGEELEVTPAEALLLPFWSPAAFVNANRAAGAEVQSVSALAYDLDQGQTFEEIRALLANTTYEYAIGASRNHLVDKGDGNGVRERLRLVLPLSRPCTDNEYLLTHQTLALALGLRPDPAAKGVARGWFACKSLLIVSSGSRRVDPIAPTGVQPERNEEEPIRMPRLHLARALQSAIDEIKAAGIAGSGRDAVMTRNAYGLGRLVENCGISRDKLVEILIDACIEAGYDPQKTVSCVNRQVDAGMQLPREVAVPKYNDTPRPVEDHEVVQREEMGRGPEHTDDQLLPMPPKPGAPPVDLDTPAGLRWLAARDAYQDWHGTLRNATDARIVVVEYDQSRVVYLRKGLRCLTLLGTTDRQAGAIITVGRESGLRVPLGVAEQTAASYRALDLDRVTSVHPTLWDTDERLYRYPSPKVEEGPTPTWTQLLARLSDPEAFLAHVWSAFEPRFTGRQALWLQGEGNDGKSIALNAIIDGAGLPAAAVSDSDLKGENKFLFSSVWDKPLVIVSDSKNANASMYATIHTLTGRDKLPIEYKNGPRFMANFQGVVFITSNNMPQVEGTRANLTRLTVVTMEHGDWIDDLPQKLRSEMPALLYRARETYARLCPRHNEIEMNEASKALLADTTGLDDEGHAAVLHLAGISIEGDGFLERKEIRKRLLAGKGDMHKLTAFYKWLGRQPGVTAKKIRGESGFGGLKA